MFLEWSKKPKLYARREVAIALKEQKEVLERSSDKTRIHETGTTGSDSSKEPVNRKNPHKKGTAASTRGVLLFFKEKVIPLVVDIKGGTCKPAETDPKPENDRKPGPIKTTTKWVVAEERYDKSSLIEKESPQKRSSD